MGPLLSKRWELATENMEKPSSPQSLPMRSAFRNPWSLRAGRRAGVGNTYLVEEDLVRQYLKDFIGVYKPLKGGCKVDRTRL